MSALTREQAESIIEAGILAPSADNRHMLRFEIAASAIQVWGSPEFEAAPFHRRVLGLIGLGAVVENMELRAGVLGLRSNANWTFNPGTAPLATLTFTAERALENELESAIPHRHTNRRVLYRGPGLANDQQRQMTEDAQSVPGVRLVWLDAPELRRKALRLVTLAESERFRSEPLHQDLFSSIRFDVGWRATATEGLPPGALEIEYPMRPMFKVLRHWSLMRPLSWLGVHRMIGIRAAYAPCRTAPHLCVLATTLGLDPGAVAVGRALERVWLRATSLGLAFQPLAASALLALEGYRDVDERVRRALIAGWAEVCAEARPLVTFRIGFAAAPSARAARKDAGSYLAMDLHGVNGLRRRS